MAREKMVTRTIEVTTAHYTALDITTSEVKTCICELTGSFSESEALKIIKKESDTESFKVVVVNKVLHTERLYGIPETVFIKLAKELDPDTRKPL